MLVLKGFKTLQADGTWTEGKTLTVEGGKFSESGNSSETEVIEGNGRWLTPGIIDVHTHLGVHEQGAGSPGEDFNETSDPVTPHVRAIDGINPLEEGFEMARKAGVTTAQIMPGSANAIGGEMLILKTDGSVVDDMIVRAPSAMKAALGENPKRAHGTKGREPVTRMGIAALIRETFYKTREYLENERKPFNLKYEQLAKVLNKEIPLRVHAHRAEDIATAIRIKREFDIDLTVEHCTEGHKITDFIAESGISVSLGPTMSTKSKVELADMGWETALALDAAGVNFAITTDHPVIGISHLVTSAITAVKNGLSEASAWRALTVNAARHLGIENSAGRLAPGFDADFVIWDGDPFDLRSQVTATYIGGKAVYEK